MIVSLPRELREVEHHDEVDPTLVACRRLSGGSQFDPVGRLGGLSPSSCPWPDDQTVVNSRGV